MVGATIRLGRCLDLLDPSNVSLVKAAHADLSAVLASLGQPRPKNANTHKYLDCVVFNYLHAQLDRQGSVTRLAGPSSCPCKRVADWLNFGTGAVSLKAATFSYAFGNRGTFWLPGG